MPFESDEEELPTVQQSGLKNISSKKSMFDDMKKKPTQKDLEQKIAALEEKDFNYKQRASNLALKFLKLIDDKTLPANRGPFHNDMEREVLLEMINLANEINNDPEENEGMGSLSWITLLFKTSLSQRDRLNKLEFAALQIEKKYSEDNLCALINKEIAKALDNKKNNV